MSLTIDELHKQFSGTIFGELLAYMQQPVHVSNSLKPVDLKNEEVLRELTGYEKGLIVYREVTKEAIEELEEKLDDEGEDYGDLTMREIGESKLQLAYLKERMGLLLSLFNFSVSDFNERLIEKYAKGVGVRDGWVLVLVKYPVCPGCGKRHNVSELHSIMGELIDLFGGK